MRGFMSPTLDLVVGSVNNCSLDQRRKLRVKLPRQSYDTGNLTVHRPVIVKSGTAAGSLLRKDERTSKIS